MTLATCNSELVKLLDESYLSCDPCGVCGATDPSSDCAGTEEGPCPTLSKVQIELDPFDYWLPGT